MKKYVNENLVHAIIHFHFTCLQLSTINGDKIVYFRMIVFPDVEYRHQSLTSCSFLYPKKILISYFANNHLSLRSRIKTFSFRNLILNIIVYSAWKVAKYSNRGGKG